MMQVVCQQREGCSQIPAAVTPVSPWYAHPRPAAVTYGRLLALFIALFIALCVPAFAQAQPKPELAPAAQQPPTAAPTAAPAATSDASAADPYVPREGISGSLQIVGSTTVQQAAALWADGFSGFHPEVKFAIDCRGSELAIPKLAKGGNVIAVFSRAIEPAELATWRKDIDSSFQVITIGHDPVAVVVHPDNPLAVLSWNPESKPSLLAKLAAAPNADAPAPSKDAAPASPAIRWSDLGVTGDLADKPITIYALDNTHGTRRYVDQLLQSAGDNAARIITAKKNQTELIAAVRGDRQALGFVRATVANVPGLKVVAVQRAEGPAINPLAADSAERDYPLVRPLTLLVSLGEKEKPNQLSIEFVSYVLSRLGQIDLVKDGLSPLSRPQIQAQQELLGQERLR